MMRVVNPLNEFFSRVNVGFSGRAAKLSKTLCDDDHEYVSIVEIKFCACFNLISFNFFSIAGARLHGVWDRAAYQGRLPGKKYDSLVAQKPHHHPPPPPPPPPHRRHLNGHDGCRRPSPTSSQTRWEQRNAFGRTCARWARHPWRGSSWWWWWWWWSGLIKMRSWLGTQFMTFLLIARILTFRDKKVPYLNISPKSTVF